MNKFTLLIIILVACLVSIEAVDARPIASARDGTGTRVKISGSNPRQYDIGGGMRAGANLFHSLQKFGLSKGQIANFLSKPDVRNILSRVVGGEASLINGLMKVTGGKSNLYFMNPAGIVFGKEARLNVPGSFIATTAKGVQVGKEWFKAAGTNDYAKLAGSPSGLGFTEEGSGAIVNAGDLAVAPGEHIALVGGTVINTGKLSAPGGAVTIAAVPGEELVRVSQEGQVLALDLPVAAKAELTSDVQPVTPASLAALLTGGDLEEAAGMVVEENGVVKLTASDTTIPDSPGVAIASGTLDVSNTGNSVGKALGGNVNILGEKVGLVGTRVHASGTNGGGQVLVGGDYKGQGEVPTAKRTYVSPDSTIRADALEEGNGGKVVVWSDETTAFHGDISVRGGEDSGNGGFVEVSGKEHLAFRGDVDLRAKHGKQGKLLLDPRNITIVDQDDPPGAAHDGELLNDNEIFKDDGGDSNFTVSRGKLESLTGDITLEARNDIRILDIASDQLNLQPGAGRLLSFIADADGNQSGSFEMEDRHDTLRTNGGHLNIRGASVTLGDVLTGGPNFSTGNMAIQATRGDIRLGNFNTKDGLGGSVSLTADAASVTGGDIWSSQGVDLRSLGNLRVGSVMAFGTIVAKSLGGNIHAGKVDASQSGSPGRVELIASGFLVAGKSFDTSINVNGGSTSLIQIKVGTDVISRGNGQVDGVGAKILIDLAQGPFSVGNGPIPPGQSGTVGDLLVTASNSAVVVSLQDGIFGTLGGNNSGGTGGTGDNGSGTGGTGNLVTLAAQTLEYDDEAGEQDSDEEACSPADPSCESHEAGLLDVSAVLPDVPIR